MAHPPLVSERDFIAAQNVSALPQPLDGHSGRYLLTGLIRCQVCGRDASRRSRIGDVGQGLHQRGQPFGGRAAEDRGSRCGMRH
jgi:hypothetical protein